MHLIQLLLPVKPGSESRIAETRTELVAAFEGVTAYDRAPAKGAWVAPSGHEEHDDVIMVEVVVETLDREWWRQYGNTLASRFGEEKIHIRFIPAEVV
jgi:hypothetical protein